MLACPLWLVVRVRTIRTLVGLDSFLSKCARAVLSYVGSSSGFVFPIREQLSLLMAFNEVAAGVAKGSHCMTIRSPRFK